MSEVKEITTNCTPKYKIMLDIDPNPNGYPVLWIMFNDHFSNKRVGNYPLGLLDTHKLIEALQKALKDLE